MKKILFGLLLLGTVFTFSQAEMKCQPGKCGAAMKAPAQGKKMMHMFQSVPQSKAVLLQTGKAKIFCPECGMTLPMFYKTNHAATVNGQVKQYCSMHCLLEDMQKGAKPTDIRVVDVTTLQFIPVEKASYVVGSHKKGTMTSVSKYAFGSKGAAEAFAKANGGTVTDFTGALAEAKKDFAKESKMIGQKQAMMAQKGEMVYNKMCQKTDKKFETVAQAKAFVADTGLCPGVQGKKLQAVGLYLKNR
jgi:nitrous oxide reductase accessory protein NosL